MAFARGASLGNAPRTSLNPTFAEADLAPRRVPKARLIQGDLRQKPKGQSNRERTECRIEARLPRLSSHRPSPGSLDASLPEDLLRRRVKVELRKRMSGLRRALPEAACAERSTRIADRLLSFDAVRAARAVASFWPLEERHEVDLRTFDALLRERHVRVAYPRIGAGPEAMTFHLVAAPEAMEERTVYGARLRQPGPGDPPAGPGELDVIIVPALAVDPRGQRIGYGAGFYDRALPRFLPSATSLVVVFDFQLVAEVPSTPEDCPVDFVITDARTLKCVR
jgi:5-formyltetrahydrofolate cyclo-ligase